MEAGRGNTSLVALGSESVPRCLLSRRRQKGLPNSTRTSSAEG